MPLFDRFKSMFSGKRLNVSARFSLLRKGISGTMSNFYMARDLQTGQVVGLKILDPKKLAMFEARFKGLRKPCEGEIVAQIRHPRIVEVYDYGITTEGSRYLVMEFLEGPDLNSVLVGRDPRLQSHYLHWIRQAAEAVDAVHKAGFIHRDICPRNFLLTDQGKSLKLIDFGLTVPATREFMLPGNRTGLPDYMAPELLRRRATDQRLDIFSFGVTAYELCAHELPWPRAAEGKIGGVATLAHDHPPADIHNYRPDLHPLLAKAIHSCIEPDVANRCPSMERFLQMIRGVPG